MGYRPLPSHDYLAQMLGLTPEEMEWFQEQIDREVRIDPSKPQAGLETIAIIATVISVGLTIAASFFKPKAANAAGGGGIRSQTLDPVNITRNQRFAPRRGFDAVQQPAVMGTTTPVVYAYQRYLPAQSSPPRPEGRYGGVRVNMPLLWSQLLSTSGSQVLRAIFMLGEGRIACIEPTSFAIGDNTLGSYDFSSVAAAQDAGRITLYYSDNGGRLKSSHYLTGRAPATDIGNAENSGGADVFCVQSTGNNWLPDACFTSKPTTQTSFGVYSLIPNNLGVRVNPRMRPTISIATESRNKGKSYAIKIVDDPLALAEMWKSKYWWSGRSGIISTSTGSSALSIGDTFTYLLSSTSDAKTRICFNADNTNNPVGTPDTYANCGDVANTVAGRQMSAADALTVGELYKAGSCLAVLVAASPSTDVFRSEVDNNPPSGGTSIYYTFKVVRAGYLSIVTVSDIDKNDPGKVLRPQEWGQTATNQMHDLASLSNGANYKTATNFAQIFRCALANVQINQQVKCFEIGFKSTVGIKAGGLCNFRDAKPMDDINYDAGFRENLKVYNQDRPVYVTNFQSGAINDTAQRYSFFRIYIRSEGSGWIYLPASFGIRSQSSQAIYNYIRIELPEAAVPEVRFEPLTGWEIRNGYASTPFIVLDGNISSSMTLNLEGYLVTWSGTTVSNTSSNFKLYSWEPTQDLGYNWSDEDSMLDPWGKVAEAFVYEEVQTTVAQGPEHEVAYVNVITSNATTPQYEFLAIVGGVFRAATEWTQFSQFSVRVTGGRMVRRLLNENAFGPSNLLPDIAYDLARSSRLGLGQSMGEQQIDLASLVNTATWLKKRRYFFDGVLAEKVNLRQWLADTGTMMLVDLIEKNGKLSMEPAVVFPEDGKPIISGLYTAGNILPGSFSLSFIPEEDRQPIQASGKWREERSRSSFTKSGVFPVEREVRVREADRPESDPIEAFDLSEYCTNFEQCVDALCYIIRLRRLITHEVKFTTCPSGIIGGLYPGAYIRVALDYTYYDEFANGVVLLDGTLITTRPDLLTVGTHSVTSWDGVSSTVNDSVITVGSDGKASPGGIIFVKKNTTTQTRTYKVDEVSINSNRDVEVSATFHPTDASGYSMITKNWTTYVTDANWVIQRG
jgi:hypothetical protein